jgi:hypothetical protein
MGLHSSGSQCPHLAACLSPANTPHRTKTITHTAYRIVTEQNIVKPLDVRHQIGKTRYFKLCVVKLCVSLFSHLTSMSFQEFGMPPCRKSIHICGRRILISHAVRECYYLLLDSVGSRSMIVCNNRAGTLASSSA